MQLLLKCNQYRITFINTIYWSWFLMHYICFLITIYFFLLISFYKRYHLIFFFKMWLIYPWLKHSKKFYLTIKGKKIKIKRYYLCEKNQHFFDNSTTTKSLVLTHTRNHLSSDFWIAPSWSLISKLVFFFIILLMVTDHWKRLKVFFRSLMKKVNLKLLVIEQ